MKIFVRILIGLFGIAVMIAGVRQVMTGLTELGYAKTPEKVGQRFADTAHGCSYLVPEGWDKKEGKGGSVKFFGQHGRNMSVLTEASAGTLRQYVDTNIAGLKQQFADVSIVSDTKFTTAKGAEAIKLAVGNKLGKEKLRQTLYFFDGKDKQKIIFTATVEQSDVTITEPILDSCAKSLEILP